MPDGLDRRGTRAGRDVPPRRLTSTRANGVVLLILSALFPVVALLDRAQLTAPLVTVGVAATAVLLVMGIRAWGGGIEVGPNGVRGRKELSTESVDWADVDRFEFRLSSVMAKKRDGRLVHLQWFSPAGKDGANVARQLNDLLTGEAPADHS